MTGHDPPDPLQGLGSDPCPIWQRRPLDLVEDTGGGLAGNLKQPHSCPMSALCPPRPRMPHRLTLRMPRRALIELQSLAAAAETPVAAVARHLLLEAIASAASRTAVD